MVVILRTLAFLGLNISSLEEGGCVLLRALEPIDGKDYMAQRRIANKKKSVNTIKDKDLCSGPSKLCQVWINVSFIIYSKRSGS